MGKVQIIDLSVPITPTPPGSMLKVEMQFRESDEFEQNSKAIWI